MVMQKTTALALATALALPGIAMAEDEPIPISANVTFTTDYVFRGISQSDEKFAVQGGFDWASEKTGIYLGTWASNVDFNSDTSVELDAYGGWTKSWGDWGLDVGGIFYDYPGESSLNTMEIYVGGSWKWVSAKYYYSISDDYFGFVDADGSQYLVLAAEYTFPMGLSVGGSWGKTKFEGGPAGAPYSANDYDDYLIYAGYSYTGLDFKLSYADNDIDNATGIAEDRVFFSVTKTF